MNKYRNINMKKTTSSIIMRIFINDFFVIVFLILLFSNISFCQVFGDKIERNIQSTVLIKIGSFSGSGILVQDSLQHIHLITAKHVLFDQKQYFKNLISNQAVIQFYAKNFKSDSVNYIFIDLKKLLLGGQVKTDSVMDIALVTLAKVDTNGLIHYVDGIERRGHYAKYFPYPLLDMAITKVDDLFLGEDVIVVGFPSSIGLRQLPQFDYNKPLLKRGAIASISDNFKTFIIDCPVYHGNSGGPVFLERKSFDRYSLRLIGIAVEYIPLLNPTASQKDITIETSSYAVVVPIEYAFRLIE